MLTTNLVECFVLEPFSSLGRLVLAGLIEVGVDLTLHSMLSVEFGFTTIVKFQLHNFRHVLGSSKIWELTVGR